MSRESAESGRGAARSLGDGGQGRSLENGNGIPPGERTFILSKIERAATESRFFMVIKKATATRTRTLPARLAKCPV